MQSSSNFLDNFSMILSEATKEKNKEKDTRYDKDN